MRFVAFLLSAVLVYVVYLLVNSSKRISSSKSKEHSSRCMRWAYEKFGQQWGKYVLGKCSGIKLIYPNDFYKVISEGYCNLTSLERRKLERVFLFKYRSRFSYFFANLFDWEDFEILYFNVASLMVVDELNSDKFTSLLRSLIRDYNNNSLSTNFNLSILKSIENKTSIQASEPLSSKSKPIEAGQSGQGQKDFNESENIVLVNDDEEPINYEKVLNELGIDALNDEHRNVIDDSEYEHYIEYERLGSKYEKDLNLSSDEVIWLNKIPTHELGNIFLKNELCEIEVCKLYNSVLNALKENAKRENKTIYDKIDRFYTAVDNEFLSGNTFYISKQWWERIKEENDLVFRVIFKKCENAVRTNYLHKLKVNEEHFGDMQQLFQLYIGHSVDVYIDSFKKFISPATKDLELLLNKHTTTRWKYAFGKLCKNFKIQELKKFKTELNNLEELNVLNPSIENMFYDAYKFVVKYDRFYSLQCYYKYIYYDLKSDKIHNKQISKSIQKKLFDNDTQLEQFMDGLNYLSTTLDLEGSLKKIEDIYEVKRRKIILDKDRISEVTKSDIETVKVLNKYLQEDIQMEGNQESSIKIKNTSVTVKLTDSPVVKSNQNVVKFNNKQVALIELMIENNYTATKEIVNEFCRNNDIFPGSLIDSINEIAYEIVEDILIEEVDDKFQLYYENYIKIN